MVRVLRRLTVVGANQRLGSIHGEVDRAVAEVDFRLSVVEAEGSARFRAHIVTQIAVGDGITLGDAMVSEVQIAILAAVTPLEKALIPVGREWQLDVIAGTGRDETAHVAIGGRTRRGGSHFSKSNR